MLGKIIRIMKMNDPLLMCFYNIFRQQKTSGNVFADFTGHIISLYTVYGRIFIGIFLFYLFIIAF